MTTLINVAIDPDGDAAYNFDGKWYGFPGATPCRSRAIDVATGTCAPFNNGTLYTDHLDAAPVIETYVVE